MSIMMAESKFPLATFLCSLFRTPLGSGKFDSYNRPVDAVPLALGTSGFPVATEPRS
jgi:hypothetical protein